MMPRIVLYPLCFAAELLICEAIFVLQVRRRPRFGLRLALSLLVYFAAATALNVWFSHLERSVWMDFPFFLAFFAGAAGVVLACFRLTLPQAVFVGAAGYSVQHIADSLVKIGIVVFRNVGISSVWLAFFLLTVPYFACAALFYFLLVKPAALDEKLQFSDRRVLGVSGVSLCICLVLSVVTDHAQLSDTAFLICKVYAILGCLLCLLTQVGLFRDGKIERTNRLLNQMIQIERKEHRLSRETIDFINIRCHDLRHQLGLLNSLSEEKRKKSVEEMSHAIMIYDSITHTGCEALDTVLMGKKLLCEKYAIRFSFVGDGKKLAMMEEVDVYALFGNILDNAIESLREEPDEEKRIITLRVYSHKKMLYIEADNYYSTPLVYREGELQTSKRQEPGMHGYGLKSIAYIVSAYRGDLLISTENQHFLIQIMLPETQTKETATESAE